MVGSSASISEANVVLNTAVAEELRQFADELENAENFTGALHDLIKKTVTDHKRIIFNGNGYNDAWIAEAEKRGLLNLKSTPDCLPYFLSEKNVKLFTDHGVLSETEMRSRYEIMLENYSKTINIEALTMVDMVNKDILPAISAYVCDLAKTAIERNTLIPDLDGGFETDRVKRLSSLEKSIYEKVTALESMLVSADFGNALETAKYFRNSVFTAMQSLRVDVDMAESITATEYWPFPTYGDLLFGVR